MYESHPDRSESSHGIAKNDHGTHVAGSFTKTPWKSGSYTDDQKKGCIDLHINCAAAVLIHLRLTNVLDPVGKHSCVYREMPTLCASESVSNAMLIALLFTLTISTIINGKAILSLSLCLTSIFIFKNLRSWSPFRALSPVQLVSLPGSMSFCIT